MENTKGNYWTKIAIMAVVPAILVGIIYVFTLKPNIDLLDNSNNIGLYTQIDSASGGNSKCRLEKTAEGVDMIFTLGSSISYPYVALECRYKDYSPFPIEDYAIEAEIESAEDLRLSIRIQEEMNFGNRGKAYPIAIYSFGAKKGECEIKVPLKKIKEIPEWWYEQNPQWRDIDSLNYKNVNILRLYADNSNEKNVAHTIRVKSLRLVPVAENECMMNAIKTVVAFWIILAVVALYLRRRNEKKDESEKEKGEQQVVYIPYEKLDTEKDATNLKDEILTFIGKNYPNPELKLADIAKALSMTEDKTSEEIRVATGKSFKAYLNTIRIEESKRLLKETTMQISEIAFSVGYNNVQHFNRVFKESVGVAPGAFRDGATGGEESPEGKA